MRTLWMTLGLVLALGGCAAAHATSAPREVPESPGEEVREPVAMTWDDVPTRDAVATARGAVRMSLASQSEEAISGRAQLVVEAEGERSVRSLGAITLAPGEARSIDVDLAAELPEALRYSAVARVELVGEDGRSITRSESIYFHPTSDSLVVYGAHALRDRFGGGDYQGLDPVIEGERPERVMSARVREVQGPVTRQPDDVRPTTPRIETETDALDAREERLGGDDV